MPPPSHRTLTYRPALDGLRALAVLAVFAYHLWPGLVPGGWLGVDLFFVLSGFLITSLLLAERARWGSISLVEFWTSRARRLLPPLVPMLVAVLVATAVLAPTGRRGAISADVVAAFFYVSNWRFLFSDEAYFQQIAMPSPVVHTWSLSIEEQFYLIFPVVLIGLLYLTRKRRLVALALVAVGALSLWRMISIFEPGVDPSRVYYGTDTRIFELLVGAVIATLVGRHGLDDRRRLRLPRRLDWFAWPALVVFVWAVFFVSETDDTVFRGGLLALACVMGVMIVTASEHSRSSFRRVFEWQPLRQIGLRSYALYLWHWPIIIYLNAEFVALPQPVIDVLRIALAFLLADLSLRLVERPVRSKGFGGLVPDRPGLGKFVAAAWIVAVLGGAATTPKSTQEVPYLDSQVQDPDGNLSQPAYDTGRDYTVGIFGNSIPASMASNFPAAEFPDLTLKDGTSMGCDPFNGHPSTQKNRLPDCVNYSKEWPQRIGPEPDVAVMYMPQVLVIDRRVNGRTLEFGSGQFEQWLGGQLTSIRRQALDAGASDFVVVNLACHDLPDFRNNAEVPLVNDNDRVERLNTMVKKWADRVGVPVVDQYKALCTGGYNEEINGVEVYGDGLHFTEQSGPMMWRWLAPQLQKVVREDRS